MYSKAVLYSTVAVRLSPCPARARAPSLPRRSPPPSSASVQLRPVPSRPPPALHPSPPPASSSVLIAPRGPYSTGRYPWVQYCAVQYRGTPRRTARYRPVAGARPRLATRCPPSTVLSPNWNPTSPPIPFSRDAAPRRPRPSPLRPSDLPRLPVMLAPPPRICRRRGQRERQRDGERIKARQKETATPQRAISVNTKGTTAAALEPSLPSLPNLWPSPSPRVHFYHHASSIAPPFKTSTCSFISGITHSTNLIYTSLTLSVPLFATLPLAIRLPPPSGNHVHVLHVYCTAPLQ